MAEKTVKELKIALHKAISEFSDNVRSSRLSPQKLRNLNKEIEIAAQSLDSLHSEIDAVKRPHDVFDPGNPRTIGFFIELALTTQKRTSLSAIQSAYGSGVYALYYIGDYVHYSTISGAETPIYVGQAAPERFDARTPREQGATIAARLSEHRKTIERAAGNLSINDFECRVLVVQTGWETAAEDYLIRLFKPV